MWWINRRTKRPLLLFSCIHLVSRLHTRCLSSTPNLFDKRDCLKYRDCAESLQFVRRNWHQQRQQQHVLFFLLFFFFLSVDDDGCNKRSQRDKNWSKRFRKVRKAFVFCEGSSLYSGFLRLLKTMIKLGFIWSSTTMTHVVYWHGLFPTIFACVATFFSCLGWKFCPKINVRRISHTAGY